jgi:hypothetical protein
VALVEFPADARQPVFIKFEGVEIEAAICTRETYVARVELPPEVWSVQGVYVLSGPSEKPDCDTQVRPGTTQTRPLLERVDEHLNNDEDWWRQVILIRRTTREFDNAETGFLESLLHDVVDAAERLERTPGSKSSHYRGPKNSDDKFDLETRVLGAVCVALRLGGIRLETTAELREMSALPPRRRSDEQIDG